MFFGQKETHPIDTGTHREARERACARTVSAPSMRRWTDSKAYLAHCCTIFLKSSGYQHRNPNIHIREIIWLGNQLIPTMTKSHHGGEMSVMMKVGMCQCQKPTIHHTLWWIIFWSICESHITSGSFGMNIQIDYFLTYIVAFGLEDNGTSH